MIEKVNPNHPDKIADRIAGAIVDLAYTKQENPKVAVEVLIGHGVCHVMGESSVRFPNDEIRDIVKRISPSHILCTEILIYPQDDHLAKNQEKEIRCGDNGIFKGVPIDQDMKDISEIAHRLYVEFNSDGKYILDGDKFIICQSNATEHDIERIYPLATINPLGYWTGGTDVDTGATNRKLGSDMGSAVTGGGLHGKDLSKADVTLNIYCWLKAQELGRPYELSCAIGDETVDGKPYAELVEIARDYIRKVGGFEKFAEWGLF